MKIKYDEKLRELYLPKITITTNTESILKNLLLYEMLKRNKRYILQYCSIMDSLINNEEDVEIMIKKNIIELKLGSYNNISYLFNNIVNQIENPYTKDLAKQLKIMESDYNNSYYKNIREIKRRYFSKWWQTLSILAATLLLLLTIAQVVLAAKTL